VEKLGALSTEQVSLLFFGGIKNSVRMAQKRLQRLYEQKKLRRVRESVNRPYYYYTGTRPGQIEHLVSLNWVYIWMQCRSMGWGRMHCFSREPDYKILRPDAFAGIRDKNGRFYFAFVEMDLAESGNHFDKVAKYNQLYASEKYAGWWWVPLATGFPPVIIVTTGRKERIQKHVNRENPHGLEFRVYTLEEIIKGCA